ncbi:hypothetical protein [Mucilaginibacter mallensis]|uniref:hypothetical protein n=1 Tax=Mucilaginibacter mallensis TaxID=652787 RepID=UPI000B892FC1|nr:hypothetical protein [Mucilaginibacter mallensis]
MHTEQRYNQWFLGNPAKIPVNGGKMPTNGVKQNFTVILNLFQDPASEVISIKSTWHVRC